MPRRYMWRWRDWVIEAFNDNMPFDQFTVEQIAGDMLPDPTLDQLIATGFNRNHRGNGEGGIIEEEYAVEYVVDRVETTSTVWLGLTMGCARCHDHKYDPLTQKEFYRFFAYFNNVPEKGKAFKYGNSPPFIPAPTPAHLTELDGLEENVENAKRKFDELEPEMQAALEQWEASLVQSDFVDWTLWDNLIAHYRLDGAVTGAYAASARGPRQARRRTPSIQEGEDRPGELVRRQELHRRRRRRRFPLPGRLHALGVDLPHRSQWRDPQPNFRIDDGNQGLWHLPG